MINYLRDKDFLKRLDNVNNKFYLIKIEVLDSDENIIQTIEGQVQSGSSLAINGNSPIRRTCSITFIATDDKNDLTDINGLLSINKRIRIKIGFENNIDSRYDKTVWFPLGIFIINQPSISHNSNGCLISLSCKDKMCLLDGSCGGNFPTSVTFDEYDQIIGSSAVDQNPTGERLYPDFPNNYTVYVYEDTYYYWTKEHGWVEYSSLEQAKSVIGTRVSVRQRIYDIIQTLVCNYGGIPISKIFINDIPLEIKQLVRWTKTSPVYYIYQTKQYTTNKNDIKNRDGETYREFKYDEDIGYQYVDFTYAGSLVSSIGENVCSILNKIKNFLGNYEFFFDVEGNFIFQEVKNYLNTSYNPLDENRIDNYDRIVKTENQETKVTINDNNLSILNETNYQLDLYNSNKSVYTFSEGNGLVSSYQNNPDYSNIKNDFHIWGTKAKDKGLAIHYHVAIKRKPSPEDYENKEYKVIFKKKNGLFTGQLRLRDSSEPVPSDSEEYDNNYTPADWRAAIYLQGLEKQANQIRPDIYEQELLDLFDAIYDFRLKKFKIEDIVNNPNELSYWFDYMEPVEDFYACSVDNLGTKIYSYQEDKLNKLFSCYVPNNILIYTGGDSQEFERIKQKCYYQGQSFSNINDTIYKGIAQQTTSYTAQDTARELLYQYTNYNESISIQCIPIYYLDANTRITVQDEKSGIFGDYIINTINIPLSAEGTMTISAGKALERI